MKSVEIFFKDLSKEKQEQVVEAAGVGWGDENNWDVCPLTVIDFEEEKNNAN